MLLLVRLLLSFVSHFLANRPFDSKILHFSTFFIRVIPLTYDGPRQASTIERTRIWVYFPQNLLIFEPCKISENNCIANWTFTSFYNIKIVDKSRERTCAIFIELCKVALLPSLKWNDTCKMSNFRIKVGNVQTLCMVKVCCSYNQYSSIL